MRKVVKWMSDILNFFISWLVAIVFASFAILILAGVFAMCYATEERKQRMEDFLNRKKQSKFYIFLNIGGRQHEFYSYA